MDKILTSHTCTCGCNKQYPDDLLRITAGNDFTIELQLTVKQDDGEWTHYDMNDMSNVVLSVVSNGGQPIEVPLTIDANGNITAVLDAQQFTTGTKYGFEVTWRDDQSFDRRAVASNVFMFVNDSRDATDSGYEYTSHNPYEYNLQLNSDLAVISIGRIPDVDMSEYYTKSEVDTTLLSYVTNNELNELGYIDESTLFDLLQSSDYIREDDMNNALTEYVTNSDLNTMSYATTQYVDDAVAGATIDDSKFVHKTGDETIDGTKTFNERILGANGLSLAGDLLVNHSFSLLSRNLFKVPVAIQTGRTSTNQLGVSEIVAPFETATVSTSGFKSTKDTITFNRDIHPSGALQLEQLAKIDPNGIYEGTTLLSDKYMQIANMPSIPENTSDLNNDSGFITNSDLDSMSYITASQLDQFGYITNSDLDTMSYVTSEQLNERGYITNSDLDTMSYVTSEQLNERGYITNSALSDYVTNSDLDSMSYATTQYVDDAVISIDTTNFYTKSDIDTTLLSYATHDEIDNYNNAIATALTYNKLDIIEINAKFGDYYNKTQSDTRYVTSSQLSWNYVDNNSLDNVTYTTAGALCDLDSRVTTLEQGGGGGGTVPSNVVTCDDANEIIMLTQSQYDALQQSQQLDPKVFYYITDATSNYVSFDDLNNLSYATTQYVDDAIQQSGGGGSSIDESKLVHLDGAETITGEKTFTRQNLFNYGTQLQYQDNLYGFYKSSLFSRGSFNQACIGEIILPNHNAFSSSWSLNNVANEVGFFTVTGGPTTMSKTQVAKIDSTGIYEGTTLLADKYTQSTDIRNIVSISQNDYDTLVNNQQTDANTLYIIS